MCLCVSKQGLLRVAIENARAQEKQDQLERTELKMELVRERELRETLERQLSMEQKNRGRPHHYQASHAASEGENARVDFAETAE